MCNNNGYTYIPDEDKLSNPKKTIEVLKDFNIHFQKKFGQNFLIDPHVLEKIIAGAGVTREDTVIEIGPGIGTLTQYLAESAGKVIAVEIDRNLIPVHERTLGAYDNIRIIHGDIMSLDIAELIKVENDDRPVKIVANLPYYITTPIIMKLFEEHIPLINMTVMVQKEVAARMKASPGSKDYGALSLAVQYYAKPYLVANVPRNCFMPRPNVDSAVIRLTLHEDPPVRVRDEQLMFRLIRASFNQRRKTLVNGIYNSQDLSYDKDQIVKVLDQAGLPDNVRGEALTLDQFAGLADSLGS